MHAEGLTRSAFVNFSPSRGNGDYFALTLNLFAEPIYFCPYFSEFRVMSQYSLERLVFNILELLGLLEPGDRPFLCFAIDESLWMDGCRKYLGYAISP